MMKRSIPGVLVAALAIGCGSGGDVKPLPKTAPVTGTVKLKGKPLSTATVTFSPKGQTKGIECVGVTDEAGNYKLTQVRGAEGAPPGEYKVTISRLVKMDGTAVALGGPEQPADVGAIESLPPQYSNSMQTTLTANVPESGGAIPFDLK